MFGYELHIDQTIQKEISRQRSFMGSCLKMRKIEDAKSSWGSFFPYIEHYAAHKDNILNYEYGDENYEKTIKKHRIYSGNFFPYLFHEA